MLLLCILTLVAWQSGVLLLFKKLVGLLFWV